MRRMSEKELGCFSAFGRELLGKMDGECDSPVSRAFTKLPHLSSPFARSQTLTHNPYHINDRRLEAHDQDNCT